MKKATDRLLFSLYKKQIDLGLRYSKISINIQVGAQSPLPVFAFISDIRRRGSVIYSYDPAVLILYTTPLYSGERVIKLLGKLSRLIVVDHYHIILIAKLPYR